MRVLVCGASGCVGSAVAAALRARGHAVVAGGRSEADGERTMNVDFMRACEPAQWAQRLRDHRIDAVVNSSGILMERRDQRFERIHAAGPVELFRGAAQAGVRRIVQVSALGVRDEPATWEVPYLRTKLQADDALRALPVPSAVLRPSLIHGPGSRSAVLFATLASLPVVGTPGRGRQSVQPIHVYELAEMIVHLLERSEPPGRGEVFELGGPEPMSYREMLATYRAALGLGPALWLPVPAALMQASASLAEWLPQTVLCRDTLRMLERGNTTAANGAHALLGRAPTSLAQGLAITPVAPMLDLHISLSPLLERLLRATVALLWLYTAVVTLAWPEASGVLELLARCGWTGTAGVVVMLLSCTLNIALGATVLLRPGPWVYVLQVAAVAGYTLTAAWNMPELTLDHCGPLAKNLPLLGLLLALWCAHGRSAAPTLRGAVAPAPGRRPAVRRALAGEGGR